MDCIELMKIFQLYVPPGGFNSRHPPLSLMAFIEGRSALPKIADVQVQMTSR
jgi:hypothetical protein